MPIKTVEFVLYLSDVVNLGFSELTIQKIKQRLIDHFSFGTNLPENYVVIYPHIVAFEMHNEDKIVRKFNYTVLHELIHGLLEESELNTEEMCHAWSMILTDDRESNVSGQGHHYYQMLKGRTEIVVNEEPKFEAEKLNAARNLSRMRLVKHHELTGL
jgi:hypothetical protein